METLKAHPVLAYVAAAIVGLVLFALVFVFGIIGIDHINEWWAITFGGEPKPFLDEEMMM